MAAARQVRLVRSPAEMDGNVEMVRHSDWCLCPVGVAEGSLFCKSG